MLQRGNMVTAPKKEISVEEKENHITFKVKAKRKVAWTPCNIKAEKCKRPQVRGTQAENSSPSNLAWGKGKREATALQERGLPPVLYESPRTHNSIPTAIRDGRCSGLIWWGNLQWFCQLTHGQFGCFWNLVLVRGNVEMGSQEYTETNSRQKT